MMSTESYDLLGKETTVAMDAANRWTGIVIGRNCLRTNCCCIIEKLTVFMGNLFICPNFEILLFDNFYHVEYD